MTDPVRDRGRVPASGPSTDRRRTIARKWTYLLSLSSYLTLSHADLERELLGLTNRVFEAITCEPLPIDHLAAIGERLVELHGVGKASLRCTVDVLAGALLADPELQRLDRLPERVAQLLGALASGYADAIRSSTMEQQDALHRALLEINWKSEHRLRASETRLDAVLDSSLSAIAITDLKGRFIVVNDAIARILGERDKGATLFDVLRPSGVDLPGVYRNLCAGTESQLALRLDLPGRDTPVSLAASLVRDDDGRPRELVTVIAEESELHRDAVTGLPNREHFTARLAELLHSGGSVTVYELQLDGFSLLSNGLGRGAGDGLLHEVATRLGDVLVGTENATVARLDGATFVVAVPATPSAPDTGSMIRRIQDALAEPVRVDGRRLPVSVSIGAVHQPAGAADPAELVRAADLARSRARLRGRGQWTLFDPSRDERDREALALAASMPDAWDAGQLQVGYRPVVALSDEAVLGLEALLLWQHPLHGAIAHERCHELAERTGLMLPLGDWLLRRAGTRVQRQRDLSLHVNLTAGQSADRDLVVRVRQALADTGLAPVRLRIGMPMPALRTDRGSVANLRGLAAIGVRTAVHDFGGSPAELAALEGLDLQVVHLSPALVRAKAEKPSPMLVAAISDVIKHLHRAAVVVVVDNLATRAQVTWWRKAGADRATGPLFTHS
jgi:diguanylate cyclase (GGDEF)-like protein/PAS domain S-box-containing protein